MEYGYARVSTKEQNELRQLIALREFGLTDRAIFVDKQSGKDFDRRSYQRLLRKLKDGDTLVIKSIDRLGRNYEEIHGQQENCWASPTGAFCSGLRMTGVKKSLRKRRRRRRLDKKVQVADHSDIHKILYIYHSTPPTEQQ